MSENMTTLAAALQWKEAQRIAALEAENERLTNRVFATEAERDGGDKVIVNLKASLQTAEKERDELRADLQRVTLQRDESERDMSRARAELRTLRAEHADVLECACKDDPEATDGINGWAKRIQKERDEAIRYRTGHLPDCAGFDFENMRCGCGYLDGHHYREWADERDRLEADNAALRAKVAELEEQRGNWRLSSVCREKQMEIDELRAKAKGLAVIERQRDICWNAMAKALDQLSDWEEIIRKGLDDSAPEAVKEALALCREEPSEQ